MNDFVRKNWLFLCLAIVVSFAFNVVRTDTTFADVTITFTGDADVPNPPKGEAGEMDQPIIIQWDGDMLIGTSIVSIVAPSGLKFTNVAGNMIRESEPGIVQDGTDLGNFLSDDGMTIDFRIETLPPTTGSLIIGSSTVGGGLQLCPKDDAIMNMTEGQNLPLTVTANGKTTAATVGTFNSLNLLNRPEIVSADEVSATEIQLMLKSPVNEGTGTGTVNTDGSQFLVSNNKFDDIINDVTVTEAAVDATDMTKVNLTLSTSLDFDKNPVVRFAGTGSVVNKNDNDQVVATVDNDSLQMKTIRRINSTQPVVSVDKDIVGIEALNGGTITVNTLTAKIESTEGQPLKLKLVCADDEKMVAPMDLDNVSVVVDGQGNELTNEHVEAGKADSPANPGAKDEGVAVDPLERSRDILCIPGAENDGDIDVTFVFGSFGTMSFFNQGDSDGLPPLVDPGPAVEAGEEKNVKLMVSAGGFMDDANIGSDEFIAGIVTDDPVVELAMFVRDEETDAKTDQILVWYNKSMNFQSLVDNPPTVVEEGSPEVIGIRDTQREDGISSRHILYTLDKRLSEDMETKFSHDPNPAMPTDFDGTTPIADDNEDGIDQVDVTDDGFTTTTTTLVGETTTTTLEGETTTTLEVETTTTTTTTAPPTTTTTLGPLEKIIEELRQQHMELRELIRELLPDLADFLDEFFPIEDFPFGQF